MHQQVQDFDWDLLKSKSPVTFDPYIYHMLLHKFNYQLPQVLNPRILSNSTLMQLLSNSTLMQLLKKLKLLLDLLLEITKRI